MFEIIFSAPLDAVVPAVNHVLRTIERREYQSDLLKDTEEAPEFFTSDLHPQAGEIALQIVTEIVHSERVVPGDLSRAAIDRYGGELAAMVQRRIQEQLSQEDIEQAHKLLQDWSGGHVQDLGTRSVGTPSPSAIYQSGATGPEQPARRSRMKLYVGNLAFATSSEELQTLFAQAGTVESASVVEDRETGRSRGFGFVEMSSKEEGEKAIEQFRGKEVNGRPLNVNEAKPRENRSGSRGGYAGRSGGSGDRDSH
jgi:hypothetical protein